MLATIATVSLVALAGAGGVTAYEAHRQANAQRETACYESARAYSAFAGSWAAITAAEDNQIIKKKYGDTLWRGMLDSIDRCS